MIKLTLKDGNIIEVPEGSKMIDAVKKISKGLARNTLGVIYNGKTVDLNKTLDADGTFIALTFDDLEGKKIFWHTSSHILAQAVKRLYKNAKLAIGPATDTGFYYDFDIDVPFTEDDIVKIEEEMKKIVKEELDIEYFESSKEEALKLMKEEPYKIELINELPDGEIISFYRQGDFVDLCAGPHIGNTKDIKAFKILSATGAYWRGSEKNKMLSRLYAVGFPKQSMLEEHLAKLEEAKSRDHNKLGRELGIFTTSEPVGQGLPLLMPKGAKIIQILQRFVEDEEERRGYEFTKTPLMAKKDLYEISGHWQHYKEDMFIIGDENKDEEVFALRPMTCPFQYMVYKAKQRSYRDLPIRYAETSTLFRKEASGEMHGLIRMRQFTLSDGHIMVTPDQVEQEFNGVADLIKYFAKAIGLENEIYYRFSRWDPDNKEKYIDMPEEWDRTEAVMEKILKNMGITYYEAKDEAAFYGPKLDVQYRNVHGKEDTLFTIQIDFALAENFDMYYIDENGEKKRPYIIHRSSIGCYERTLAMLIERTAGALPVWLMPTQVEVIPVSDKFNGYASEINDNLRKEGIRSHLDNRAEKVGYKIREAQNDRVPYMLVIGEEEVTNKNVSVRRRREGDAGAMSFDDLLKEVKEKIDSKIID